MSKNTPKKKVGLALSGGAARGMAHVGVLDVLHEAGIPIDMIAGTSAGAVMGAVYASGMDMQKMIEKALDAKWKKFTPLVDPSFPKTGLLKGAKIKSLLASFMGGELDFKDLKIPFTCVATDIDTGEEVLMDRGPLLDALRATISVPGIFAIVERGGRYLVDGGLTTPVPVHVVKNMGADFIIAVNVNADVSDRMGKSGIKRVKKHKEPNILSILMQSFYITTYSLARRTMEEADVIIEPDMPHIGTSDFSKAEEMIEKGRQAARAALPEIRRKLGEG
ncbi:MAG: patatin-like phospholipase family protein [Dehalococcoidales bacterium]|jgi:NTE family protein